MIVLFVVAVMMMTMMVTAVPSTEEADLDSGYPAGFLPNCPGMMNNATISARTLQNFQIVTHTLTNNGKLVRRTMPIAIAHKMVARIKYIDLRNKKTLMYAGGFLDSSMWPQNQAIGTSYSKRGYNVFLTETFSFLSNIYPKSARLTRTIGKKIGEFLVKLTEQGLSADNLELVGLSLGSHIVGYAAKHYFKVTGKKPARITGLDPAGPCFRNVDPEYRLDASDANKVDVLHTNIDGFGIAKRLGHIDVYVNGGEFQPSDILYIPCLITCSHVKSALYWWQALENPKKFISMKCDTVQDARLAKCYNSSDTNYVGLETDFSKPGIYYLSTNNEFPYYQGQDGLKAENEIYTSTLRRMNSGVFEV